MLAIMPETMVELSNETADVPGRTAGQTRSEWHWLLAMDRRRLAMEILAGETPPTDLEALATELAAREREQGASDGTSLEHITATLHHAHLPKLAEIGVIDYDPQTHRIDPDTALMDSYRLR